MKNKIITTSAIIASLILAGCSTAKINNPTTKTIKATESQEGFDVIKYDIEQVYKIEKGETIKENIISPEKQKILNLIKQDEVDGKKPFSSCQILTAPKTISDFGFSSIQEDGSVDTIYENIIKNYVKENSKIFKDSTDDVKEYINCLAVYGTIVSESLKTKTYKTNVENNPTVINIKETLEKNECRFNHSRSKIKCGEIELSISKYPSLNFRGVSVFNGNK